MASWTDSLSGLFKGTPQTAPTYTSTVSETPKWLQDYTVDLFSQARAVAGLPYQTYPGQRIAQPGQDVTQSYDITRGAVGDWQQPMQGALTGTQNLANTTSVGNINQYMNPYTENVVNRIAQLGQRNLNEVLLPGISDQFIGAGQFGSSRMGEFGNRALRDTQEAILGQQGEALQQGYSQALTASAADMARQQGALQQAAQMTQQQQALSAADAAALQSIGEAQRTQQQLGFDTAYQDFLRQQQWPQQNVAFMSDILRGLPSFATASTQTGTGTQTNFAPSPLSTIASLLAGYKGLTSQ